MPTADCHRCGEPLKLTQPDDEDYVRILATCPGCGRWYLRIEVPGGHSTLSPLPVPTLSELGVRLEPVPA